MKTLDGSEVTWEKATQPVGSALRIAPGFLARTANDELGVSTTVEARYSGDEGRYVIDAVTNRVTRSNVELNHPTVAKIRMQAIVQAAAPRCIFLTLDDEQDPFAEWLSVDMLTTTSGRIIPPVVAELVTRRGSSVERMEAIEILYGAAALSSLPPARLIERELGVPHRTASAWIIEARKAGRLAGMNYNAGRPAGA